MNSGHALDRMILDKKRKEEAQEREANLAAPVIAQGNAAEAFKGQPFWKVIERDLTELENVLVAQLTDTSKNLTKYAMDELRRRITDMRLFKDLPNKYIEKLQDKRRGRKVV